MGPNWPGVCLVDYALFVLRLRTSAWVNVSAKLISGFSVKAMLGREMFHLGCKGHDCAIFWCHMTPRADLWHLCSSLHSKQILSPAILLWNLSEGSLEMECPHGACHALWLWKALRALDRCGCGISWLALSEILSLLLLGKGSPEVDRRQTSTHVGPDHLRRGTLPFDVVICFPSHLRAFWSSFPAVWSGFVFLLNCTSLMFPTTEVIFLQVTLQRISYWGIGYIPPFPRSHYTRGIKLFYDKMPCDGVM